MISRGRDNVVSHKGLKKHNLPYIHIWIIYYAWVVAFATWWTASPLTENVFGSDVRSMMHATNLFSSAVFIIIIRKEWFITMARIGALLLVVSMAAFLAVPSAMVQLISTIVIGISLGCVNAAIIIPFIFTLNNTEKLYAVIAANLLISLISLFQNSKAGNILLLRTGDREIGNLIFSYAILLLGLSFIAFFKKSDIPLNTENPGSAGNESNSGNEGIDTVKPPSRVYLVLIINCIIAILCKGVGKGILDIAAENFGQPLVIWHFIGGLIGCLIYFIIYAFTTHAYIILVNFSFALVALGFLCNAFAAQAPEMAIAFSALLGIGSTMGMINMYYIIGVIGKKYNSMRYLRLSIVLVGICGGVSGVIVGNLIHHINTFGISVFFSVVSVAVLLIIMIATPLFTPQRDFSVWAKDSEMPEIDNEQLYLFNKYKLSKREIEVCKLLLKGYTLRQISAMLSIAYSTVNTYCTSAYRKLNINSRTELMILFKDFATK